MITFTFIPQVRANITANEKKMKTVAIKFISINVGVKVFFESKKINKFYCF
jgi:hypothetical protein